MYVKPLRDEAMSANPQLQFADQPVEAWSLTDLTDALGIRRSAQLLGLSEQNVRTHRCRGAMNLERTAKLQAAVLADEAALRSTLHLLRTGQAHRGRATPTKETHA